MGTTLVIIPTYNEIENIQLIIRAVMSQPIRADILIVDDNSPDGTAETVTRLQGKYDNRLHLEVRSGKQGLGTAYIHGFRWALQRDYNCVFEMDADFSHDPDDLEVMYNTLRDERADVVIGSRYVKGVNVVNWPMNRVLMSYFASKYVRFITRMGIHDTTAGFVCYKADLLRRIDLDKIKFTGYAFQIEMKFKAWLLRAKIVEVPVIFADRTRGKSKLSSNIISEAVTGVIKMKLRSLMGNYKI